MIHSYYYTADLSSLTRKLAALVSRNACVTVRQSHALARENGAWNLPCPQYCSSLIKAAVSLFLLQDKSGEECAFVQVPCWLQPDLHSILLPSI